MKNRILQRVCVLLTSLSILGLGAPAVSYAGIIGTGAAIEAAQPRADLAGSRTTDLATIRAGFDRQDVSARLSELGVERAAVDARLAALSDQEVHDLAGRMQELPAGGDALAVIGIVFVVLVILEIVGVIDIFKKA